jgi:peptide-methionine (R)-S-oxide reductase
MGIEIARTSPVCPGSFDRIELTFMKNITRRGLIFGAATVGTYGLLVGVQRVLIAAFADDAPRQNNADTAPVTIVRFADDGTPLATATLPKVRKTIDEWKKQLSPLSYDVTRRAETEWAFSGDLDQQHAPGLYRCIDCDNAVFNSTTKFDSGTGWPSFWKPIAEENVYEKKDISFGTIRREVRCTLCDAHLGHVFADGPLPTGLRYCMNSVALRFVARNS